MSRSYLECNYRTAGKKSISHNHTYYCRCYQSRCVSSPSLLAFVSLYPLSHRVQRSKQRYVLFLLFDLLAWCFQAWKCLEHWLKLSFFDHFIFISRQLTTTIIGTKGIELHVIDSPQQLPPCQVTFERYNRKHAQTTAYLSEFRLRSNDAIAHTRKPLLTCKTFSLLSVKRCTKDSPSYKPVRRVHLAGEGFVPLRRIPTRDARLTGLSKPRTESQDSKSRRSDDPRVAILPGESRSASRSVSCASAKFSSANSGLQSQPNPKANQQTRCEKPWTELSDENPPSRKKFPTPR
jgi:hypothetical protein